MGDCMTFPDSVEKYMEQYKIVDTKEVYTNGAELVPIFRMKQWFEHLSSAQPERKNFEKQLHAMFDHIWDCEIDHPVFQDTVGELMEAVIQVHKNSVQPEQR